jgi:peptide chain release factor 2
LRWAERKGFKCEELDYQPGEVAGIKGATILVQGDYAYGSLRSEQGVHRLVRISPFDSNARRHTSFASIAVTPDIEEEIEIEVDEKDLRVDTYRSSGAGGQHVNKTDSAVRLTHIPTNIVVACQNERSQHKNKAMAMKILKAKLYELEKRQQDEKIKTVQGERKKIDFGSQIRSYVMQPYQLIKDLRTDYETSSVNEVLDGDIDQFIESYLLSDYNRD